MGRVRNIVDYGAFINLGCVDGLLHLAGRALWRIVGREIFGSSYAERSTYPSLPWRRGRETPGCQISPSGQVSANDVGAVNAPTIWRSQSCERLMRIKVHAGTQYYKRL